VINGLATGRLAMCFKSLMEWPPHRSCGCPWRCSRASFGFSKLKAGAHGMAA